MDYHTLITPLNHFNSFDGTGRFAFAAGQKPGLGQSKLALPVRTGQLLVEFSKIVRCQSDNNYTWFFFNDGDKKLISKTLKEYEILLKARGFYRVHQSHLVNSEHIDEYIKGEQSFFMMSDGTKVPVSQRKKSLANKILKKL
ncbi:MAG TPA: LytTR family DNA-binding domain-containing protein [Flavobacteriales bacterium]|nr:LytTR family DNA-binding domain-containing protein [Flavobacteriales bacterium]